MKKKKKALQKQNDELLDLAYWAWTVIANTSEGDWSKQTEEWQTAATRWRDQFHQELAKGVREE